MKKIFFTPGPSQLYFTVEEHLKKAVKANIGSISHRSQDFKNIYKDVDDGLRVLLNLPDNFNIVFTSSATEVWERILLGCVNKRSLHLVNGAFSNKFYQTALSMGFDALQIVAKDGRCANLSDYKEEIAPELISFTHNETSTGASHSLLDIYSAKQKYPESIISVDAVSSLPFLNIDYDKVDLVYFSVQKCFGLPAGLGVMLVNNTCYQKARQKEDRNKTIGSSLSFLSSFKASKNFQTPATPNVLSIYLLAKVVHDMNNKGIDMIRRETEYKAAVLYHTIKNNELLSPFVKDPALQSKTTIVAETENSRKIIEILNEKGMVIGKGYGKHADSHIRIANFPTHSKEQVELLAEYIEAIQ